VIFSEKNKFNIFCFDEKRCGKKISIHKNLIPRLNIIVIPCLFGSEQESAIYILLLIASKAIH